MYLWADNGEAKVGKGRRREISGPDEETNAELLSACHDDREHMSGEQEVGRPIL